MAITYSKSMFIERIRRHLANGWPRNSFSITDNEVMLYIDGEIPFVMKYQMFENAKVLGTLETPEAYINTYELTATQDANTQEWVATLPQPPMDLPLGYSITRVYYSIDGFESDDAVPLSAKRSAFRSLLPQYPSITYRVNNGQEIRLKAYNNANLYGNSVFVEMPISRTDDKTATMNLPDSAISMLFDRVVARILQRYNIPQDIIKDDLPAGNKQS